MDWHLAAQMGKWLYTHLFADANSPARSVGLFGVTFASALATQLLFWDINPEEIFKHLLDLFPSLKKRRNVLYLLLLALMILGALVGYSMYDPRDMRQATLAGAGWYTAIRSVRTRAKDGAAGDRK